MPLDPQARRLLQQIAQIDLKPIQQLSPQEARDQMLLGSRFLAAVEPVHAVEDLVIEGPAGPVPLRIYRPREAAALPALLFLHGGGWMMGSVQTHDSYCRSLCLRADAIVVSVEYRLAPEHKFPAGLEDAYAAALWLNANARRLGVQHDRIAVGGDSAGGNLAAATALLARDRGAPPLCFQLLIYPVLDYRFDTASYLENASGYHLTREDMLWTWRQYLGNELDGYSPLASPLQAEDLSRLPAALVITAQYDPLRDEGSAYARRLSEAGVPVIYRCYDGMIHGFVRRMNQFDRARTALDDVAGALRSAFASHVGCDPQPG